MEQLHSPKLFAKFNTLQILVVGLMLQTQVPMDPQFTILLSEQELPKCVIMKNLSFKQDTFKVMLFMTQVDSLCV